MCQEILGSLRYGGKTIECTFEAASRVFMTTVLAIEAIIRKILESVYNFVSSILQLVSLIPMMLFFCVTTKLRWLFCGSCCGSGELQKPSLFAVLCECVMSALLVAIVVCILGMSGHLDMICEYFGYWRRNTASILMGNTSLVNTRTKSLVRLLRSEQSEDMINVEYDIDQLMKYLIRFTTKRTPHDVNTNLTRL